MIREMLNVDPKQWLSKFNDWNFMKLKESLVRGEDFTLLSESAWQTLNQLFGGAPEILFFIISKYGQTSVTGNEEPDLEPIKIDIKFVGGH